MSKKKGVRPHRGGARLGQHFLIGTWAATKLAEAAGIKAEDTVLEIGPGKGALTKEILKTGARVIAIEKDAALVAHLRETLPKDRLVVINADIRDIDPKNIGLSPRGYILAANIPYYITGEIIRQFLSSETQPKTMALLIQKEVAERIIARPAKSGAQNGKESILSLSVKAYGGPSIAAKVSKGNFTPPPSVDSAILVVQNISKDFFYGVHEAFFFEVVRTGFAAKRKLLASNLSARFDKASVLNALNDCGIPAKARAEDISLNDWRSFAQMLENGS